MKLELKPIPIRIFKNSIKLNYSKISTKLCKYYKSSWDDYSIPIYGAFVQDAPIPLYDIVISIYNSEEFKDKIEKFSITIYDTLDLDDIDGFYNIDFSHKEIEKFKFTTPYDCVKLVNDNLEKIKTEIIKYHNHVSSDILGPIEF